MKILVGFLFLSVQLTILSGSSFGQLPANASSQDFSKTCQNTIAEILQACDEYEKVQHPPTVRIVSGSTLSSQTVVDLGAVYAAQSLINEKAVRASLEIVRQLFDLQNPSTAEESNKAYGTTKLLNALLGTSVGIVGSGMQFSNNTSVQHIGDGVSVAGGALTVVFALCTAELPRTPYKGSARFEAYLQRNSPGVNDTIEPHEHKRCHIREPKKDEEKDQKQRAFLLQKLQEMNDGISAFVDENAKKVDAIVKASNLDPSR